MVENQEEVEEVSVMRQTVKMVLIILRDSKTIEEAIEKLSQWLEETE